MNEGDTLYSEEFNKSDTVDNEVEEISETENHDTSEASADEQSESDRDLEVSEEEEEEKPSSTVIQVIKDENSDTGYSISELDVTGLNDFVSRENELRSVNPTSNDYYTWLGSDIESYFSGIMANYPMNKYKAVHLKHWIQNTSYNSYYDDYYYLWYDYPSENVVEVYKQYNNSQYVVSYSTQRDLNASIVYGSEQGQCDLRKGVSYVQEMALLSAVACCLVLYILHAFFKHLVR